MNSLELIKCYNSKASNAESRGKEFSMSLMNFANLKAQKHCAYSGIKFDNDKHEFSFERLDNSIGYVDGNVIAVSRSLNSARSSLNTVDDIIERIHYIREAISNKQQALVSVPMSINQLKREIHELESDPVYASIEKPVIPPLLHEHWLQLSNRHKNDLDKLAGYVKSIKDNKKHIATWESKTSKHAKSKIYNLNRMNDQMEENISKILKRNVMFKAFKGLETRTRPVSVENPKIRQISAEIAKKQKLYSNTVKSLENAVINIENLKLVMEGLRKFENLSAMDKQKLKLGLPLNASLFTLLKNKIGYNLISVKL